jgi:hypothetical protein
MNYDQDKVDEMVLALLYLTISEQDEWGAREGLKTRNPNRCPYRLSALLR